MAKRGPKHLPAAIIELRGNPKGQQLNKARPRATGKPVCPSYLPVYGKTVWKRIQKHMPPGLYSALDTDVLAAYCQAAAQHKEAVERLEADGYFTEKGVHHAAWAASNAANLIAKLGGLLGLNPSSRDQLEMPEQQRDDWDGLLK